MSERSTDPAYPCLPPYPPTPPGNGGQDADGHFDPNGNGYLSLAKVVKSLLDLGFKMLAPAQMCLFQAAKKSYDSNNEYGDNFVWNSMWGTLHVNNYLY